ELRWELPHRPAAHLIATADQVDIEPDRPIAQDRLGARLAQPGGEIGGGTAQPEGAAPGWVVTDDQRQCGAEQRNRDHNLDQSKSGLAAMTLARPHRLRPRGHSGLALRTAARR